MNKICERRDARGDDAMRCKFVFMRKGQRHCGHVLLPPYLRRVEQRECERCPYRTVDTSDRARINDYIRKEARNA